MKREEENGEAKWYRVDLLVSSLETHPGLIWGPCRCPESGIRKGNDTTLEINYSSIKKERKPMKHQLQMKTA